MARNKPKEPQDRILLVEGADDREVIYQFCNHYAIDNRSWFSVQAKDGIDNLIEALSIQVEPLGLKTLGIVVDADTNLQNRWQQIRGAVAEAGYDFPVVPDRAGTILESSDPDRPRLGIWLMPNNQLTGTIEDFLLRLTQDQDTLLARARTAIDSIPATERLFKPSYHSKALIHTWLAWQPEPGTALGLAITRQYLDPSRNPAPEFKIWLEALFLAIS